MIYRRKEGQRLDLEGLPCPVFCSRPGVLDWCGPLQESSGDPGRSTQVMLELFALDSEGAPALDWESWVGYSRDYPQEFVRVMDAIAPRAAELSADEAKKN